MAENYTYANNPSIEAVGMKGFCKVVCEVLLEFLPGASVQGFRNEGGHCFSHVFLVDGDRAIDIKGVRTVEEIAADVGSSADPVSLTRDELQREYFVSDDDPEERETVRTHIRSHVAEHAERYGIEA